MGNAREDGIATLHAASQQAWREWLEVNHETEKSVWLIIYKKESGTPSVYYPEAVDEALCFGWIDSKPNKRDEKSYFQFFAKRNPKSKWSGVNKRKVTRLLNEGRMAPAGQKMVELARQTGTWEALNDVEALSIPHDMEALLKNTPAAATNFSSFPPSTRRGILEWISNAKKPETRQKRIEETVSLAAQNIRANQYKPKG
ncbi:MAG: YdeI/OmpD-associated family protein [Imperialibacter sp.]|uniref:YdeI/OmpD-associated family protein n=1 Tax=Imperialibacter sp. TaxID=2038411 RepID=UPI0032EE36ED